MVDHGPGCRGSRQSRAVDSVAGVGRNEFYGVTRGSEGATHKCRPRWAAAPISSRSPVGSAARARHRSTWPELQNRLANAQKSARRLRQFPAGSHTTHSASARGSPPSTSTWSEREQSPHAVSICASAVSAAGMAIESNAHHVCSGTPASTRRWTVGVNVNPREPMTVPRSSSSTCSLAASALSSCTTACFVIPTVAASASGFAARP